MPDPKQRLLEPDGYIIMGGNFAKDEHGNSLVREECEECGLFLDDSDFHDDEGNCLQD